MSAYDPKRTFMVSPGLADIHGESWITGDPIHEGFAERETEALIGKMDEPVARDAGDLSPEDQLWRDVARALEAAQNGQGQRD